MKTTTTFLALILASSLAMAQNVRVGVLGLFHPCQFELSVTAGSALVVHIGGESAESSKIAEVPFNSARKWSSVTLASGETLVLGAPEVVLPRPRTPTLRADQKFVAYVDQIRRVFELAREYDVDIDMHLDFGNTPDDLDATLVCDLTEHYRLGGRVAVHIIHSKASMGGIGTSTIETPARWA